MDPNERRDAQQANDTERSAAQDGASPSSKDPLQDAPPGSGMINSSRSGQSVSDNPVLRADRDAGDILADQVRESEDTEDGKEGEGARRP